MQRLITDFDDVISPSITAQAVGARRPLRSARHGATSVFKHVGVHSELYLLGATGISQPTLRPFAAYNSATS